MTSHSQNGTLTGLAVGDSLGMPFEMEHFLSDRLLGWGGDFWPGNNHPINGDLKAGQWTDDTKMARALAESLVETTKGNLPTYSPADAASRYLAWFQSGDLRGIGTATGHAMHKLNAGFPWAASGTPKAEGNGSAMRVAPLGLFFRHHVEFGKTMAKIDARITHLSKEAEEGSAAVAVGVALLANKSVQKEHLIKAVSGQLEECQVKYQLMRASSLISRNLAKSKHPLPVVELLVEVGVGAHVIQTVPAAFLAFVKTNSFQEAVVAAVKAGGDCDTTAAITGALAGTYYGIDGIPDYYKKGVEDGVLLHQLEQTLYVKAPHIRE
jgi:ADP-ribosylglycohydrolase